MLKYSFFLFFIFNSIFAQYTVDDYELVKSTFYRKFDKNIIDTYLLTESSQKVKAGLLSVSHSEDTTFVDNIIKLDFEKYGDYISFALGQIGACKKSSDFILSRLFSYKNSLYRKNLFEALGKVTNRQVIDSIVNKYFKDEDYDFIGISLALANYNFREKLNSDNKIQRLLCNEFSSINIPINRRIEALYSLNRIGPSIELTGALYKILEENNTDEESITLKQFALACLQKVKSFPDNQILLNKFLLHKDWRFRAETVKAACYFPYKSLEELNIYLSLLKDKNPNVSRQTAASIKNLAINDSSLKIELNKKLIQYLNDKKLSENSLGELFVSYSILFPETFNLNFSRYLSVVKRSYMYTALIESKISSIDRFAILTGKLYPENKSERIDFYTALIEFQDQLIGNKDFENLLIAGLKSDYSPVVTIIADAIDSSIVMKNKEEIKNIIISQTNEQLQNFYFYEGLTNLVKLSQKIDTNFFNKILAIIHTSGILEIKNIAFETAKEKTSLDPKRFNELWQNAFLYKGAVIKTNKGNFTISLLPGYSPITVGNFCTLAKYGFYNDIIFHRVVPNFVIQTGDPDSTGWNGPGYEIVSEFSMLPFDEGYAGMASSGKDTEGSQWFVMHGSFPHLNGRYSNFGKILSGQDIVNSIDQGDKIITIQLSNNNSDLNK